MNDTLERTHGLYSAPELEAGLHPLRAPCPSCRGVHGEIRSRGGQDCVFCRSCNRFQYNAPRVETGRAVRSVQTVHEAIKPKLRAQVLERATGRCELCGARTDLHVGHLLSVEAGLAQGLTETDLNSTENLCAMCPECNLGLGKQPVPLRLAVAIVMARLKRNTT